MPNEITTGDQNLNLAELDQGMPGITPAFGKGLAEATSVCFEDQKHSAPTTLLIDGSLSGSALVAWEPPSNQAKNCWNDVEVTTEHAAYGLAFLILKRMRGFEVIQRSRKGPGFDYWIGDTAPYPFQDMTRLEVSGIRSGDTNKIKTRVEKKLKQTNPSDGCYPATIVVVEFSKPIAKVVDK